MSLRSNGSKSLSTKANAVASGERIGIRARLLTFANALFLILVAANEFVPNATSDDPRNAYLYAVAFLVFGIQLVACLFAKKRATRDAFADVAVVILAVLAVWLLLTAKFDVLPAKMFPSPGVVFAQIVSDHQKILEGVGSSLSIVAEGFALGAGAGIALGLVLGFNARVNSCAERVVSFLAAIPPIVYIPYGIALLPTFRASSVLVIFLATFWPVLTATLAGVSNVDERAVNSARVLNVKTPTMLGRVMLPFALPLIFNGLNIGLTISFILLTSAEMIGGRSGMGYYVKYYSDFGDYTRILAGIIVIGVVITVISLLFGKLQKHLTRWK